MDVRPPGRKASVLQYLNNFDCKEGGISPISSNRIVPMLQISNFPGLARTAPVKAPCS